MPTYDYECTSCRHRFELFQPITAGAVRKCPSCGKMKVRRRIGAGAGVIFKGSGFYQTDYRSESYKAGAKKEQPPAAPAGKPAEGAAAKPAPKKHEGKHGGD